MTEQNRRPLYSCECGGFKFHKTYSRIYCACCGELQPGTIGKTYTEAHTEVIGVDLCRQVNAKVRADSVAASTGEGI